MALETKLAAKGYTIDTNYQNPDEWVPLRWRTRSEQDEPCGRVIILRHERQRQPPDGAESCADLTPLDIEIMQR